MPSQRPNPSVPQSMLEGLQMILGELGGMMATPDADVNFLTVLQHTVVAKIKQSTAQSVMGGQGGPGGPGGQPGPGPQGIAPGGGAGLGGLVNQGALQQMGAGGPGGGGPGGPGPGPGQMPNPDEFRRVIGANAQVG